MPAVILAIIEIAGAAFSRLMATQLGRWILQALLFFGISFVSNTIVSGAVTPALQSIFAGMGGDLVAWIAYTTCDRAITIILSADATVSASRWTIMHTKKG